MRRNASGNFRNFTHYLLRFSHDMYKKGLDEIQALKNESELLSIHKTKGVSCDRKLLVGRNQEYLYL